MTRTDAMPHDIIFIGSSSYGLRCLVQSPHFTVREAFCLASRVTRDLEEEATAHNLKLSIFSGSVGIRAAVKRFSFYMPFFIYQLDTLVPADVANSYSFYNVHRGDLYTNRGPTPDIWPILNGDLTTALSLHKINEKVDAGILIDAIKEPIRDDDDVVSLRARVELHLPRLIFSMHEYLAGIRRGAPLSGGTYRPWITERDFTIDPERDSMDLIDRKIRCQCAYNGAIVTVESMKRYVTGVVSVDARGTRTPTSRVDGPLLRVDTLTRRIVFRLNENPIYPPPPIRAPSKRI